MYVRKKRITALICALFSFVAVRLFKRIGIVLRFLKERHWNIFLLAVYFAISLIMSARYDWSFGSKGIRARDDFLYMHIKNWIVSLLPFLNSLHSLSKYRRLSAFK